MASKAQALAWSGVDLLRFEDFYAAEYDRVLASAYAFCRNRETALDATQEAFARAFARWRRLEKEEWAGAWVTTTALNALKKQMRHAPPSPANPQDRAMDNYPHHRTDLLEALRMLPARQRLAATLYYIADLPVAVVASSMGLSEGAVKAHLSRARDALRFRLEERDG